MNVGSKLRKDYAQNWRTHAEHANQLLKSYMVPSENFALSNS